MLYSANGYPYAMSTYGGKSSENENLAVESKVVSELLPFIDNPERHKIFLDNLLYCTICWQIYLTKTLRQSAQNKILGNDNILLQQ